MPYGDLKLIPLGDGETAQGDARARARASTSARARGRRATVSRRAASSASSSTAAAGGRSSSPRTERQPHRASSHEWNDALDVYPAVVTEAEPWPTHTHPDCSVTARPSSGGSAACRSRASVLVKVGDVVTAETIVARTELPGNVQSVNVANLLGILRRATCQDCLTKKVGDAGRRRARSSPRASRSSGSSRSKAPGPGHRDARDRVDRHRARRSSARRRSRSRWTPTSTARSSRSTPKEGVTVETRGTFIQGIFGVGGETVRRAARGRGRARRHADRGDDRRAANGQDPRRRRARHHDDAPARHRARRPRRSSSAASTTTISGSSSATTSASPSPAPRRWGSRSS